MVKVVVIGSYSDTKLIGKVINELVKRGFGVFPQGEEFKDLAKIIASSETRAVSDETMERRRSVNLKFMDEIRECDFVYVFNEKDGEEYIGPGTLMQMGFAIGARKPIFFYREPHIEEVLSLAGPLVLQVYVK